MEFSSKFSFGLFEGVEHQHGEFYVSRFKDEDSENELDVNFRISHGSRKLIVVLPSAISKEASDVRPIFHRWSWAEQFDCNFLCLSDPSFDIPGLLGGWFIADGSRDVFEELRVVVSKFIDFLEVEEKDITFYGSSMGGFGALMLSSYFPKSLCVAEVPQVDLRSYPWKRAIRSIEEKCLSGKSLGEFYKSFPERVSVIDRFEKNKSFPNVEVVSNAKDVEVSTLSGLYDFYLSEKSDFDYVGNFGITLTNKVSGHMPLPKSVAIRMLKFFMRKHQIF